VATASVNPMAGLVSGPEVGEARLTDLLQRLFHPMGLACQRQPVEANRDNLLVRLDGDIPPERGGSLVLWGVHQDTVPTAGMTIDPFAAEIRGGRLYGRGACDVKGGMAAMIAALARLAEQRSPGRPTIVLAYAAFLAATGVPTVVFGPGSIRQAHTADEWIDLDQLMLATEIFYHFGNSAGGALSDPRSLG